MNVSRLAPDVIHQQILAKRVRSSEIGFAAAKLSNLLDEVDEAVVARQHESVDENPGAFAFRNFFKRLRDYKRIKSERVLVDPAVFQA